LSLSGEAKPSDLMVSNNKFICRADVVAGNLRCVMAFLPYDRGIAQGVCGVGSGYQQPLQLGQRRQIDVWRARGHSSANNGIEHPVSNRNDDASGPQDPKKSAVRSLLHTPYADFAAKIRVPAIVYFQLLPDMGRMNGQWR
jgi:hypothetical protein